MMPAVQIGVTKERGTYLCTARALVFEGSILAYNHDKVQMYEEVMMNDDNLESNLLTSSLL